MIPPTSVVGVDGRSPLSAVLSRLRNSGPVYISEHRGVFSEVFATKQNADDDVPETRDLVAAWTDFLYLHGLNMVFFAYDEFALEHQANHNVINTHRLGLEFTAIHPNEPDKDYEDGGRNPARKFKVSRLKVVPLDQAKDMGPFGAPTEHAFESEVAEGRRLADEHFKRVRHGDEPQRYIGCVAVQVSLHAGPPFPQRVWRDKLLYLDISGAFAAGAKTMPKADAARIFGQAVQQGWMMDREDRQPFGVVLRPAERQDQDPWEVYSLDEDGMNELLGLPSARMQLVVGLLGIALGILGVAIIGFTVWYTGRATWRLVGRLRGHRKTD